MGSKLSPEIGFTGNNNTAFMDQRIIYDIFRRKIEEGVTAEIFRCNSIT